MPFSILFILSLLHFAPPLEGQAQSVGVVNLGTVSSITTSTSTRVRYGSGSYPTKHTFQLNPVNDPTTCTAILEFSLDGTSWFGGTPNQNCAFVEVLSELDFATHANWAAAGDFNDTGGSCAYTDSSNAGTCTQASAGFASTAVGSDTYTFTYLVSGVSGDVACTITTGFAAAATTLTITAGEQSTTFTSAPAPGDFVISCTSTSGGATFDNVSLRSEEGIYLTVADENVAFVRASVTAITGASAGVEVLYVGSQ